MIMTLYIIIGLLLAILSIAFVSPIRLITLKIIKKFFVKSEIKLIGDTERDAISCGDVYLEKSLFSNELDWVFLNDPQTPKISEEELLFINKKVPELCQVFDDNGLSEPTIQYIKSQGFWSINIPKEYGGLDFSASAHAKILTQLSSHNISLAVTVMVPNSLGPGELILHYGTQSQKDNYLPKLASGEHIPCFALTSKQAGSDANSMTDTGKICYREYNGEKTLGLLLNWDKRYTTLAPMATIIGLAFKTVDPDKLIGDKGDLGVSCALVDASLDGVSIGRHHHPIGSNFSNGPNSGNNVFIPMSSVIGGQDMIGSGWKMLMECLSLGRGVSLPSLSMAGVNISLKTSIEYSTLRYQFKMPIYKFQGVSEKIVLMASDLLEMKALSSFHLSLLDSGINPSISSALLKYNHTEALRNNVNRAMDIHAGKTVMLGDKNYLADIYQAIPIAITVEGSNILTRSMIIFGQGLMRCHPFLMNEVEALERQDLKAFNGYLGSHISHISKLKWKSFFHALTGGYWANHPVNLDKNIRPFYKQLSRLSSNFAFLVEIALITHGTKLKFQEGLTGILSDLLLKMYGISTLLRYRNELGEEFEDLIIYTLESRVYESQILINDICDQLKFTSLTKVIVMPRGITARKPALKDQNKIMHQLVSNTELKDRLITDVIIIKDSPLDELNKAYVLKNKVEYLCDRVGYPCTPEKIDCLLDREEITNAEHKLLIEIIDLVDKVLGVDDYEN